ncbi:MAG: hypothetical protein J6M24_00400 [Lachnospiraceae bacterium]|nr:hypothetical protein [Lachnospiraceae bacterium]
MMNLESSYCECLVKRKNTIGGYIIKGLIIALLVIFGLLAFLFLFSGANAVSLLMAALVMVGFSLAGSIFPRFNVEWEYVFVDGQLDFDQVLGGLARKRKMRTDFEKLEIIAPSNSHRLDSYKNMQMKIYDFSSLTGCDNYSMICHDGNNLIKIYFEPNEEMLTTMKNKSFRKVFTD